jgi:hypothetical protein
MAAVASYNSRIFVGNLGWHAYATGFSFNDNSDMLDVTVLSNTSKTFIPGIESGDLSVETILDTATATNFAASTTWKGTPQVVTLLHAGTARGTAAVQIIGNQGSFTINSTPSDAVKASGSVITSEGIDFGVVIDPETAITVDTNGTAVDNGASTANGGVAHLHVTAFSGLTSNSVIVEHSTDNAAWSTLGTFTLVTGTTSERLLITAGTTVNRYLRVRDDVTGTGSCTRIVTFNRR